VLGTVALVVLPFLPVFFGLVLGVLTVLAERFDDAPVLAPVHEFHHSELEPTKRVYPKDGQPAAARTTIAATYKMKDDPKPPIHEWVDAEVAEREAQRDEARIRLEQRSEERDAEAAAEAADAAEVETRL
jgi:hypothetical protein